MEFQKAVDESADSPSVPEKIRQWIHKNLEGLLHISIKEETSTGRFKQLNKITVQNKQGDLPDEDPEEICEGIMRVLEKRDAAREEDDDPISFQLMAEIKRRNGKRYRPSMEYTYNPDGSPEDYMGDGYGVMGMDPRNQFIELQSEYISRLHYHLDTSHEKIKDIADNNNAAIKPIMDALGWMGHFYAAGLQNQQSALAMMYDVKKATVEERERTARQEKWMEFLKKPASALATQFMGWVGKKMGAPSGPPPTPDMGDVKVGVREDAEEPEDEEPELDDFQKENPVASYAQAAGTCFTPDQWFSMMEILKKKDLRILKGIFNAPSDQDCVAAYDEFGNIPTERLLALNDILTEEQKGMLSQLGELVTAVKKNWENEED